ncbi:globin [Marinobacterium nitratireducens]|uniref:Globin n=1 Tax=Marinobacterium nitratireducens TaxID=518897 RepID=A0A917ZHD4_9GAMM|nr:globin [Marinobacterium nitratireducens]GGO82029.1 globin [Marinobacterium nitratireducens]
MDTERLFDRSYERVLSHEVDGRAFFEGFYDAFLAASDEVAEKFHDTDMDRQQAMLMKSFYHLLSFYASNNADYYLDRVAISHNRHHINIRPALYDLWLDTLILTVRRFDPECCDETELAWRLVMTPGIVYMKFHYNRDSIVGS